MWNLIEYGSPPAMVAASTGARSVIVGPSMPEVPLPTVTVTESHVRCPCPSSTVTVNTLSPSCKPLTQSCGQCATALPAASRQVQVSMSWSSSTARAVRIRFVDVFELLVGTRVYRCRPVGIGRSTLKSTMPHDTISSVAPSPLRSEVFSVAHLILERVVLEVALVAERERRAAAEGAVGPPGEDRDAVPRLPERPAPRRRG